METPIELTFRGVPRDDDVEALVREHVAKLEKHHGRVTSCRVMIEAPHAHHEQGNLHHVRVDLRVPGGEIVVSRDPPTDEKRHENLEAAILDAFRKARRQLQDQVRRRRGDTKTHEEQPHGTVGRIGADGEHGFIDADDGREIYFHANSVLGGGFDRLQGGERVRFVEEDGERGPQASTVVVED